MNITKYMREKQVAPNSNRRVYRSGARRFGFMWLICCLILGGMVAAQGIGRAVERQSPAALRTKAIDDVKVGDWVLATDPEAHEAPTPHRVIALPRNYTLHVVHVAITGGGEVQATREHPFYTQNRGWVHAKDLRVGDALQDDNGFPVKVADIRIEDRETDTYNLTVEGVHTYYVTAGKETILVHNAVQPWQFGDYDALKAASSPNDDLVIHHYPQGQPASEVIGGYEYPKGLAVAVPTDEHLTLNGTSYKAGEFTGGPTQLIDEAYHNMGATSIPPKQLNALDAEARIRYLGKACP